MPTGFLLIFAAASIFCFKPPYAIGPIPSFSGHANAYRWRSLPKVRRHRASKPQGSSKRVIPWQATMDQLICASLSHTYYWYELGMLKAPYHMLVTSPPSCLPKHPKDSLKEQISTTNVRRTLGLFDRLSHQQKCPFFSPSKPQPADPQGPIHEETLKAVDSRRRCKALCTESNFHACARCGRSKY